MLEIVYKDKFIVVCVKPAGVISESSDTKQKNMPSLVKNQIGAYKVDLIHRLDKPVGGLMVFSINDKATKSLAKQMISRSFQKEYYTIVEGVPEEDKARLCDYLFRDKIKNKSFVVKTLRKGAKEAVLEYETVKTVKIDGKPFSLLKVRLHTGRTHQIRVQFASRKMPVMGDKKYGSSFDFKEIALFSHYLAFNHPLNQRMVEFSKNPPNVYPWKLFFTE